MIAQAPKEGYKYYKPGSSSEMTYGIVPEDSQTYEEQRTQISPSESESSSISGEMSDTSSQETAQADNEPMTPDQITDKEILGRSYPVRQMIKEANNQRMKLIEGAKMAWANLKETPKLLRLNFRNWLADGRVSRQTKRYEAAVKKTGENSRLTRHRRKKLEAAKKHKENISKARDTQEETMLARERAVGENAEQRRDKNIRELKDRAIDARARKAIRHELREQGASRREIRQILAEVPTEQRRKVGRTAIEHAITSKRAEAASAIASGAYAEKVRLEERSAAAAINLLKAEDAINEANSKIQELQSSLQEAQAKVEELTKAVSKTEVNGAAKGAWLTQEKADLQAAKDKVKEIEDNIAKQRKDINDWNTIAANARQEKASLEQGKRDQTRAWGEAKRQEDLLRSQTFTRTEAYRSAVNRVLQEEQPQDNTQRQQQGAVPQSQH